MVICTIISREGVGEKISPMEICKRLKVIYKGLGSFHLPSISFKLEAHDKSDSNIGN